MNAQYRYSADKLRAVSPSLIVCSAAHFDGSLYMGLAHKNMPSWPKGVLKVDGERRTSERIFEEMGAVYFMKVLNSLLVVGADRGLLVQPRGEGPLIFEVEGGITSAKVIDAFTILLGGGRFFGLYRHDARAVESYPFGYEDIMICGSIMCVETLDGCFALGRDEAPTSFDPPALGFLRSDVVAKSIENQEFFNSIADIPEDRRAELIEVPTFETQKKRLPEHLGPLLDACRAKRPTYVRDLFYWRGWLVVVEFNRSYAIRISDGGIADFSYGGFLIAQHPEDTDQFWVGCTSGNGLMVIRYDEGADTWTEDKEASAGVNRAISIAAGFPERVRGFYGTCVHFHENKAIIGTEGEGTYIVEISANKGGEHEE